jgi:uncharacterized phiE125 gp8 family phage protein
MRTQKLSSSQVTVITPADVREYLRFGDSSEDTVIQGFINSSIDKVERYTGRAIGEAVFKSWTQVGEVDKYVTFGRVPVISITRVFDGDGELADHEIYQDTIFALEPIAVIYKAGALRPATVSTNEITLEAHGYSVGDVAVVDGVVYTVQSVTDVDTFSVGALADGSVVVGYLDAKMRQVILEQAANEYLRGSTEAPLSKEMKKSLDLMRVEIGFS